MLTNVDEVLMHTVGLKHGRRCEPCRNHFVAGPGHHDMPALEDAERLGLMVRISSGGVPLPRDSEVWRCTRAGLQRAVAAHRATVSMLTRSQARYRAWSDGWGDFMDFSDFIRSGEWKSEEAQQAVRRLMG